MDAVSDTAGWREILVVVAIALCGVLLALLAAVLPWHTTPLGADRSVVDVTVPEAPTGISADTC